MAQTPDDALLKQQIDTYVDKVWPDVVEDVATLVAIPSVEDPSTVEEGKPWGAGPNAALVAAEGIAARLGLDVHDCEGYLGYADLLGRSEKQVATIAHTDIVPVGTGWHQDPYTLTRKDGYLIGRGVQDDKGPCVLSFYAAKFFLDAGEELPYTLRCIIGNNEETRMGDVDYYLERYPQPEFLFTPDADFPVCCGEKGGFSATITSADLTGGVIVDFDGGTVGNAIPRVATVCVRADASTLAAAPDIDIEPAGEGLAKLVAHGIGGHASMPAGTRNAIGMLVEYLLANGLCSPAERDFLELEHLVFASTDGSTLGIAATDDVFEPLTCIGGTIHTEGGHLVQTIDARYPKSTTAKAIGRQVTAVCAEHASTVVVDREMVPFYVDPNGREVQTLLACWEEYTGRTGEPFTIGGGTYARHFRNAASFGPADEDEVKPDWVGSEHGPDEGISEDRMRQALKIYILAIARLMRIDL
jgi:succinyl-diaminopimelate desuccinylase